ncbi:hypothetical protein FN846DRAFT_894962 [Sphaerosporella brunnea]|uniref:Uncharacterized protein n=1 Tax=Sphaerosporella brunnea TaxID=1250544 RepID=A0A5J5EH22_9PEZI|nr:hypothetical protein FN846DRAFT_894962 [Sphaerosporella brunnea]
MDVTRKRDYKQPTNNSPSVKRRKLRDLSSTLDGEYWKRNPTRQSRTTRLQIPASPGSSPLHPTVPGTSEQHQLVVRQTFDVGLPVVFGQQLDQPFTALQRLGVVLNRKTTTLKADEIEEPESPPQSPSYRRSLIDSKPATTSDWSFIPSWEAVCVGARILKQALVFPIAVARFLIDVAPETRQQARLLEAARREREQLQLDQWLAERSQDHESSESELSDPPPSPSQTPDFTTMSTTGPSGSGAGADPSRRSSLHPPDPNAGLLSQFQQMIDASMAKLKLELGRKPDDPAARDEVLRAELDNIQAKKAAIEQERALIHNGQWNGPTTPISPTSIYVSAPTTGGPAKPRFNPGDLLQILFGEDLEEWISHMDHIVTSFGESAVCPHVLHRCFANGDPMRDWYLTQPSAVHLFVTTGDGCWDRFKTLLRTRFKPDLGVMQHEADSHRRQPGESWAAFGIRKYRLLKRAYEGADNANIILKMKAVMDTDVVRFCKEKSDIDALIGEMMDYDRTSPAITRSPGRIFAPENFVPMEYQPRTVNRFPGQQSAGASFGSATPRYQKNKGKAVDRSGMDRGSQDRSGQDRKTTIKNRLNPETGKMVRSYLNFQGKPVFIKRPCSLCEKAGAPNQMHFSFECSRGAPARPRTYALEGTEYFDELGDGLHRTESGNLTSYDFQSDSGPQEVIYHQESDDEGRPEQGNGNGGW